MLTPEYLNLIEFNDVVELYNKLNIEITADIIKRIAEMDDILPTSTEQMKMLIQTNGQEVFNKALEETVLLRAETKKALKALFADMAKEDLQGYKELYLYRDKIFKLSETQYKILNEGLRQTNRTLKNLTKTIAFQSQQAYVNAADMAYMKVATGAFDYATSISQAVQELANKGITLKDKLGRNVQLEVAVRRNVLSGIHQTANNINRDIEEELGCDGYEVTAHIGARPTHAEEQGKQFAASKENAGKYDVGLWSDVEHLWEEYNCRHSYFGIILGISEPKYTDKELKKMNNATVTLGGKKIPYYEATQKQRALENNIRKTKRSIETMEKAGQDVNKQRAQLRQLNRQLNAFLNETGLNKDYSRLKVAKYNSTNSNKSGTMKQNVKKEENNLQYIGKLDKNKLGKYKDRIVTDDVIMTNERMEHTELRHPGDYEKYIKYVPDIIKNPDYFLDDKDNENTILALKRIKEKNKNVQVVVKLHTSMEEEKSNSILTFWHIRDRNYRSAIRNNEIIWKRLDIDE